MPKMTKLAEWLTGLAVFFGIYAALVTKQIKHHFIDDFYFEIQIFPLICIVLLGVSVSDCAILLVSDQLLFLCKRQLYAVITVLYRTFTFNDCTEAAEELQKEIKEARADLRTKGMKFDD